MPGVRIIMKTSQHNQMDKLPDYHFHTNLCKHAKGELRDFAHSANVKGIPEICCTDHAPNPDGYDPKHRMELKQFPLYRAAFEELKNDEPTEFLFGIEADYYNGCEAFLTNWLVQEHFDFVLGSVHFIDNWGFDNPAERHIWDSVDISTTWKRYFDVVAKLVDTGLFDAVSHLDLPKKFGHQPPDKALKEMIAPLLDRMAMTGIGMEINTSGLRKPVKEIYPSPLILEMACERRIPICFGSDSHSPEEMGSDFDRALALAREVSYTHFFRIKNRKKELALLPETA